MERVNDRREERLITPQFIAVTAVALMFFVHVGVLVPLVPRFVERELGAGELGIGLAIATFAITAIAVRPLVGRLIERYGRRVVMLGGAAIAAGCGVAYGFVNSLPLLLLVRGATGVGEAAVFVSAMTLVADLSPPKRRAEAASYFSVAVYGGIGVGPIIGEAVESSSGYRPAFAMAGVFAAVAGLLALRVPSRVVVREEAAPTPVAGGAGPSVTAIVSPVVSIVGDRRRWTRFIHPSALGPGLVLGSAVAAFAVFTNFLPEHSREVGMGGSGALFALYSLVALLLRIFGARLPEKLGPRTSVTTALVVLSIGLALLAAVAQPWALWVAAGLVGIGMAFNYPSLIAVTIDRAPLAERPRAISSFTMFFELGMAAGGLALGGFAQVFTKRAAFGAAVLICLAGLWYVRTVVIPAAPRDSDHDAVPDPEQHHVQKPLAAG